ncbi:MAG: phosphate acetyltransferase, partial [Bacteroidetes bacterium]|nr:phosphate acetyltransferase [Bacteroidota bacterium]
MNPSGVTGQSPPEAEVTGKRLLRIYSSAGACLLPGGGIAATDCSVNPPPSADQRAQPANPSGVTGCVVCR